MKLVLDASVVVDLLLDREPYSSEIARQLRRARVLTAPHLLDVEVTQVLRRFMLKGELTPHRAQQAIQDLLDLPIQRYPHSQLMQRAFQLADNLTIYDAVYVVLAEVLGATLLTRDKAMMNTPGIDIDTNVIG